MEPKYERLLPLFGSMLALVRNEIGWKFFREEMFDDTKSGDNAKIMAEFCEDFRKHNPDIMADLEPVLKRIEQE